MRHLKTFESYAAAASPAEMEAVIDYFMELYTPEDCYMLVQKYAPEAIDQIEGMMAGPAPMSERRRQNKYNKYRRIYEKVELSDEEKKNAEANANGALGVMGFVTTLGGLVTMVTGLFGGLESDGTSEFSGPHGPAAEGTKMLSETQQSTFIGIGLATILVGVWQFIRYGKRVNKWEKKWGK